MTLGMARIESTIANTAGKTLEKPIKFKEFYKDPWATPGKPVEMSREEQIEMLRGSFRW